ncbi:hypothetical protein HDU98_001585 [Podochytrium sp. JEL0797]|nr:hypothetical protein HDU98_001585 [Podochytrium sp. JEL0797]
MRFAHLLLACVSLLPRVISTEPPGTGQAPASGSDPSLDSVEAMDLVSHGQIERRHDYKQSFKKPVFIVDSGKVPFFEATNAILSPDSVRLTPSLPNQSGAIWAENQNPHKEWQAYLSFRASGRGYAGGDGLALWYTKEKSVSGGVMGSKDKWDGLGVVFSTSSQKDNRFSPLVYAMVNDGSKEVAGRSPAANEMAGSCMRDYRNTPHPVWVRVTYKKRQLRVDVDLYKDGYQFVECFRAKDIDLPAGYYFGLSASTGAHIHDDHDIMGLEIFEVHPHPRKSKSKFQDEYKMDDASLKAVEQAKLAVEVVEEDLREGGVLGQEEEAVFNPQMVQNLQENQFKIIEALNLLEQKVSNAAASTSASQDSQSAASANVRNAVDPVDKKVESIATQMTQLELKMDALDRDIKELFNVIRTGHSMGNMKLSEVAKKVEEGHGKIREAHDKIGNAAAAAGGGGGGGSVVLYVLFFMVGGVVVYGVSVVVRMRGEKTPKKYI